MGGGVEVEELPYNYAYHRYPFGARRIPVYNSSFPEFWSDDRGSSHDNSVYGGRAVPMFVPFKGDADSFVRKRKLDGLKGEEISSGGHNVSRNLLVENGTKASEGVLPSKPKHSPTVSSSDHATTRAHFTQSSQASATNSRHLSASNFVRNAAQPRVISIPVSSTDEGKGHDIKCTVIPREGTKKLRKAVSDEEAAVLIQAWFRGYQVRKTAPLSQLRHIANVKSQLKDFEEKVSDADYISHARENSVAKVKLTEGLMNLLLELDSVQGAHPVVRAVRKAVTKEVIILQGRVDSLLSADTPDTESSELPMEIERESRDQVHREKIMATESHSDDAVTAIPADSFREEESELTECAEPDPGQDKGEAGSPDGMKFEACKVDNVEFNRISGSFSTQMVKSDPDEGTTQVLTEEINLKPMEMGESDPEGTTQVLTEEDNLEPMELEVSKADVSELNDKVADEMERIVSQGDRATKAHIRRESSLKNELSSDLPHEDGRKVEVSLISGEPQAADVTIADAEAVRINAKAKLAAPSGRASESVPQEGLQRNKEGEREELDDKSIENGPHSPTSPFEAVDWFNFEPSNSDSEPQSELQESAEIIQGVSEQSTADNQALLLKLSEENKVLKSLLVTVMKWNQMQATSMQDVRHRLGKLESRIGNKKSSSRRKMGKTRRMMLQS